MRDNRRIETTCSVTIPRLGLQAILEVDLQESYDKYSENHCHEVLRTAKCGRDDIYYVLIPSEHWLDIPELQLSCRGLVTMRSR